MSRFHPRHVVRRARVTWSRRRLGPNCPLLAIPAVRFLASWLKPTDRVIEYGSGRSTAWLAQRAAHVESVENDRTWFDRVSHLVAGRPNVKLHLHDEPADPTTGGQVSWPYVRVADSLLPGSFELAIDDGWARATVGVRLAGLVKPGGLLIVDDVNLRDWTESPAWASMHAAVREWEAREWSDGIQSTIGFFRPARL